MKFIQNTGRFKVSADDELTDDMVYLSVIDKDVAKRIGTSMAINSIAIPKGAINDVIVILKALKDGGY